MSDKPKERAKAPSLSAEQVCAYLQDHPDFFVHNKGLLAELNLPHESGSAVSLVERQVSVLRERNMDMRHRLSKLLDNARENDKLFDKTKRLVLALIEGNDLGDTVDALYYSFDNDYEIHYTSLLFFGREQDVPGSQASVVSLHDAKQHIGPLLKNNRAMCGTLGEQELQFLFGQHAQKIGSVATVPLVHGAAFGILAIANRDPHYYRSSMGTLFLGYIAEVLNRLLPGYLPR